MSRPLALQLTPKGHHIFFDEEAHKYSNELGFVYTSTTTVIGKYYEKFDTKIAEACARIGRNPKHPKYLHYKGLSEKDILDKWEKGTKEACAFGSMRHNCLETAVKESTLYNRNAKGFVNGRIYTIDDIIKNHKYGNLKLDILIKSGLDKQYPQIFKVLCNLVDKGFSLYAEIGVYDDNFMISGLIDILAVNHNTLKFIILDWKTNKAPIRFESGYYSKLVDGRLNLDDFVYTNKTFYNPLSHLADSVGNHYTLQLSIYAYLVSTFGYIFDGLILCHIRPIENLFMNRTEWDESVEFYRIEYLKDDAMKLLNDFRVKNTDLQSKLQF